jgi:hypothetical protein
MKFIAALMKIPSEPDKLIIICNKCIPKKSPAVGITKCECQEIGIGIQR